MRATSEHNPFIKRARRLIESGRERRKAGKILLDGVHLCQTYAEQFGLRGVTLIASDGGLKKAEIRSLLSRETQARVIEVSDSLLASLSQVDTPAGLLALVDTPRIAKKTGTPFWLLLHDIQDPGNLGSILRTAAATGVTQAWLSPNCADPWSPKCLRGGMGAQFVLPIEDRVDLASAMKDFTGLIIATVPRAGVVLHTLDLTGPVAVLFGGEGAGLPKHLTDKANAIARIPLASGVESLNVSAAVAMVCYERLRQTSSNADEFASRDNPDRGT